MTIAVPRTLLMVLAAVFSAYHAVLGLISLGVPRDPGPVVIAITLYLIATIVSLAPVGTDRMPRVMAFANVLVSLTVCVLVSSQLDPLRIAENGHTTWYVAAVGTLLTITAIRRRYTWAWIGVGVLVAQTSLWAGPFALVEIGVLGSATWVGIAQLMERGTARVVEDARRFSSAGREAAEWRALQEAHIHERQYRIGQTSAMAVGMLRTIAESGGDLDADQRRECVLLEAALRDEIRGRWLLDDRVRERVRCARAAGMTVNLLDEGGLDDLPAPERQRVLAHVAEAVTASAGADRLVVRSVLEGDVAVTAVALRGEAGADPTGDGADDEIVLWLEIPRQAEKL